MNEQAIEMPCPICHAEGNVYMIAHIDEIPYFGEHTQVTILCHACGWRQTDFIPAEGKKAGGWTLLLDDESTLRARVVRSSSCTVCIPELDLEVNPGSSATGYVSNVEGVLHRFKEIINMVERDLVAHLDAESGDERENTTHQLARLQSMLYTLNNTGTTEAPSISLVLLDPHGHSMILHPNATERDLTDEELNRLPVGPDPAVFSKDDVNPST